MSTTKPRPIAEITPPTDRERHLREQVAELEHRLANTKSGTGEIQEAMAQVLAAVKVASPPPRLPVKRPATRSEAKSPVTHVVHLSDWHIGEVTQAEATEGMGKYNWATACERVGKLGGQIADHTNILRHAYRVDCAHILGTADWVSGDIHDELLRTNEFPAPVQAVNAGFLLGAFLVRMAGEFPRVEVDLLTAGNHDRLTRKCQSAEGGLNSWGYVVCEIARQYVSACANVNLRVHTSLSKVVAVSNLRYLLYHGHRIQGHYGIPFYGIERRKQKEAMARMNLPDEKHFDRIVIGHFHTSLNHEHWMIGGSLSGTNEFDHEQGRSSPPHQTSWMVHPKHGEFSWQRWWL